MKKEIMMPNNKKARKEDVMSDQACARYEDLMMNSSGSLPAFMFYDGAEYWINCPRCNGRICFRGEGCKSIAEGAISCGHCNHNFIGKEQVIVKK